MKHQEVQELLPWYVNGTLDPAERSEVDRHLRDCQLCQDEVAQQRQWTSELADEPTWPGASVVLTRAIQAIVASQEPQARQAAAEDKASPKGKVIPFPMSRTSTWLGMAAAVMFSILCYQNLIVLPELNAAAAESRSPRALQAIALSEPVRGIKPELSLEAGQPLFLELFHPEDQPSHSHYYFELQGAGRSAKTDLLPVSPLGQKYQLDFRSGWPAGTYELTLFGQDQGPAAAIATYTFVIN